MSVQVKFPAQIYAQYRPLYPLELFDLLKDWMSVSGLVPPVTFADIGCGPGLSTLSIVRSGIAREIHAIEPNRELLEILRRDLRGQRFAGAPVHASERPGESTGLAGASIDVVVCASAFHWMNRAKATAEFLRIARRPGILFFCEYAFPVAPALPVFNAWVRSKLEGDWQIPEFVNRPPLAALVAHINREPGVTPLGAQSVPMLEQIGWREILGLIQSQSRFVRKLETFNHESDRRRFMTEVEQRVHELIGEEKIEFDFRLQAAGFLVSSCVRPAGR